MAKKPSQKRPASTPLTDTVTKPLQQKPETVESASSADEEEVCSDIC